MSRYGGIPQELRGLPNWVCHREGEKVPIDPKTGRNAKSNDPETWGTFEQATDWAARNGGGIGFEFAEEPPFCGIDLDHVRDADTGELVPWAREVVDALDTYTEVSPSGTGLHLIARAGKPEGGSKRANQDGTAFEMYDHGRYFRMTGEVFEGHGTIGDRQGAVNEAHARWIGRPRDGGRGDALEWGGEAVAATGATGSAAASPSAKEAMERMRRSGKWPEISRLWDGDTSGCGGDHSAADMALCNHLAYFCDRDEAVMDELFRRSGLMRGKWDEVHHPGDPHPTYGSHTVHEAASTCRECYSERRGEGEPPEHCPWLRLSDYIGDNMPEEEPEGERVRRAREALNIHRAYDYTGERTPPPPPMLIEGLMYAGRKALITGPPKSHKSMEAIHLALALATGGEWWGHRCKRSKALYVNVEIESSEFENRVEAVRESMGIMPEDYLDTLEFSHIRGKNPPDESEAFVVDSLCSTLEDAYRPGDYDTLIIDPIYKVNPGEEDHANVAALLGRLDRHGVIMNCSIVYVHHTAKGGGAGKSIYEQGRGSGDWGGDADLMVGITELGQLREGTPGWERAQALGIADPTDCSYQIQFGTRSFRDPPRVRAFKTWPLFTPDETGALGGLLQRGDPRAKGGEVTGAKAQDRRRRRDEAVTAAVKMCGVDGVKPTRQNVYERLSIDGEGRPTFDSFKRWTNGADGLTHWRNREDEDGEWVLSECYRASDGRALYKDSKPQFLPDETGDQRGSDG